MSRSKDLEDEVDASPVAFDASIAPQLSLRKARQLWSMVEAYQREPAIEPRFKALYRYLRCELTAFICFYNPPLLTLASPLADSTESSASCAR